MRIDSSGYYVLAGGVDRVVGLGSQVDSDGANVSIVNQDIGDIAVNISENVMPMAISSIWINNSDRAWIRRAMDRRYPRSSS